MRKVVLVLLLVLLGSFALPLVPQAVMANGGVSMQTNAATDVDYFWATLNGQVSALYGGCTVSEVGFVWSPISHSDPGNTAPWMTAYESDEHGGTWSTYESHGTPFTWSYGAAGTGVGAYLWPNRVYYYRAVADRQSGGDWVYGPEESFTVTEDCQIVDSQAQYWEDYYGPDYICQDTWVRQDIAPWYTRTATELWIDTYRVGSPHELGVHIYPVDPDTWGPIWASELWRDSIDVSGITEDIAGEWVELEFGETLTFDDMGGMSG